MMSDSNTKETSLSNFGRYVTRRLIGEGGMGQVYLADDPVLDRQVAIKVITLDERLELATREEYLKRFTLEAKASAKLNHQSIVAVYDAGEENRVPWIAFEFVGGQQLEDLLKKEIKLSVDKSISIAADIAGALQHAHSQGIIHRDIKPANILLDAKTGIAKLADFGIAKAPWVGLTQEGRTVGSPGYMAPEQIDGLEPDQRTDLFALGIVLYQMVSGNHPFLRETVESTAFAILSGSYISLAELRTDLPEGFHSVVTRCLTPNRDKRIGSAREVIAMLAALGAGVGVVPPRVGSAGAEGKGRGDSIPGQGLLDAASAGARETARVVQEGVKGAAAFVGDTLRRRDPLSDTRGLKVADIEDDAAFKVRRYVRAVATGVPVMIDTATDWVSKVIKNFRTLPARIQRLTMGGAAAALVMLLMILVAGILSGTSKSKKAVKEGTVAEALDAARDMEKKEADWAYRELAERCGAMLGENDIEVASMLARSIIEMRPERPEGYILHGRVSLKSEEYEEARGAFLKGKELDGGRKALHEQRGPILGELGKELMREKAPKALIDVARTVLSGADEPVVRGWLGSENYWLRWNSVTILEVVNKNVDMVSVYILDLKHGGSAGTRRNAATKLGELGDRRAIPALRDAAGKGLRDIFVSGTAQEVLDEHFQ